MILAKGASLSFIVNGQLLKTFTDTSYTSGSIALFASNLPEAKPGIQVQFSLLAIYPLHVSRSLLNFLYTLASVWRDKSEVRTINLVPTVVHLFPLSLSLLQS